MVDLKTKKIIVAIDSFKGTLSSAKNSEIVKNALLTKNPCLDVTAIPIADGGEGTADAFVKNLGGEYIEVNVHDPLNRRICSKYGIIENGNTAVIEMASASGLHLLSQNERNPLLTSTFGTGELILDALYKGVKKIIIGIGGSATNDGGIGMAAALGVSFDIEKNENEEFNGLSLSNIRSIDITKLCSEINNAKFTVLSDVTNPLLGENGASFIYGPQKGASEDDILILENGMENLVKTVKKDLHSNFENMPGSGAAGGLGYGLLTFLNAEIKKGINYILDYLKIEDEIKTADYVITGEGKMDSQTSFNKAPWGIMKMAKKNKKDVIGICAVLDEGPAYELSKNFDSIYSIVNSEATMEESLLKPEKYLSKLALRIAEEKFV